MQASSDDFNALYNDLSSPLGTLQHMSPPDSFFPQQQQQQQPQQQNHLEQLYSPTSLVFSNQNANTASAGTSVTASTPGGSTSTSTSTSSLLYPSTPTAFNGLFPDHMSPAAAAADLAPGATARGVSSSGLSSASGPSAPSSALGSPHSHHDLLPPTMAQDWSSAAPHVLSVSPNLINQNEFYQQGDYGYSSHMDEYSPYEFMQPKSFVDPSILHPEVRTLGIPSFDTYPPPPPPPRQQQDLQQQQQTQKQQFFQQTPNQMTFALSPAHTPDDVQGGLSPSIKAGSISPYATAAGSFPQFEGSFLSANAAPPMMRAVGSIDSIGSMGSVNSAASLGSLGQTAKTVGSIGVAAGRRASHDGRPASRDSISGQSPGGGAGDMSALSDDGTGGDGKDKQLCPHPECGRRFKDLRAHMLTHQTERPEKCPIQTCEYHTRGFARKYDKNRHTLTHYKGTMVCDFCPGSGSSAEKSFNRADVFKRHLTAVHGVEQTPPNSRRKQGPDGALSGIAGSASSSVGGGPADSASTTTGRVSGEARGKCSTCSQTFGSAQQFYEHLDDCVLRIVQQEDPAEAVNASRLAEVEDDQEVKATLEKNQVLHTGSSPMPGTLPFKDDDDFMADPAAGASDSPAPHEGKTAGSTAGSVAGSGVFGSPSGAGLTAASSFGKATLGGGVQKSHGMTHSRGGVPFTGKTRSRRSRYNYPSSWGFDSTQMNMRKRVMTVFEGQRRLAKDDMMLSVEHEVRLQLQDGKSWITDLDVQTMKRAAGFLSATEEDKGPWLSDDPTEEQKQQMLQMLQMQQMQVVQKMHDTKEMGEQQEMQDMQELHELQQLQKQLQMPPP